METAARQTRQSVVDKETGSDVIETRKFTLRRMISRRFVRPRSKVIVSLWFPMKKGLYEEFLLTEM